MSAAAADDSHARATGDDRHDEDARALAPPSASVTVGGGAGTTGQGSGENDSSRSRSRGGDDANSTPSHCAPSVDDAQVDDVPVATNNDDVTSSYPRLPRGYSNQDGRDLIRRDDRPSPPQPQATMPPQQQQHATHQRDGNSDSHSNNNPPNLLLHPNLLTLDVRQYSDLEDAVFQAKMFLENVRYQAEERGLVYPSSSSGHHHRNHKKKLFVTIVTGDNVVS